MQKKKIKMAVMTGLMIMMTNGFTAYADTVQEGIPMVEPLNVKPLTTETQIGPGIGLENSSPVNSSAISSAQGEEVVAYAKQFLGNPYVYGGTSLTEGADCSGFVQSIFKNFGITLPRTSQEQGESGVDVGGIENAVPGDLVSYSGHIGIYAGNNQLVHASGPEDGIKVSNVDFLPILSVRRVVNN